jgi:CheY-like chemotaxis protein
VDSQLKKLIIFDDDEDILSICSYIMEDDGWRVQTYADCKDILTKVNSFMPDVILMDNWIPDEGGIVATQTLKAEPSLKHIPVIYFSANSDIQSLAEAAGADLVLPKPFDLDVLKETVKHAASIQ